MRDAKEPQRNYFIARFSFGSRTTWQTQRIERGTIHSLGKTKPTHLLDNDIWWCHENRAFRTRCSSQCNLKTPGFYFTCERKTFENRGFRKRWCQTNRVISLTKFSSISNQKWLVIVALLNSLMSDGKHLSLFRSESCFFKFLLCSASVHGVLDITARITTWMLWNAIIT